MESPSPLFPNYQNNAPVPPPQPETPRGRGIVGFNFLILVIYFILFVIVGGNIMQGMNGGGITLFYYMYAYLIHAGVLIIFSLIRLIQKRKTEAGIYFATAIFIPIIGFGLCAGALATGIGNSRLDL
jgi:hypothetical protein